MPPIHDYECVTCHIRFEFSRLTSQDVPKCPKCGSQQLELKVASHASYKIKGNNSASTTPKKFR